MAELGVGTDSKVDSRFDTLYRLHHREVRAYFVRRMPRSDAEDAAAEVFTVAWRRLDQIPEGDGAVGWLYGVAHKVLSNHLRTWRRALRLNRRLGGFAQPSPETPELHVVRSAEDEILIRTLDRLRLSDREILKLATWEKLSHKSIGAMLDISETAVDQRILRARKRLAQELEHIENAQRFPVSLLRRKEN